MHEAKVGMEQSGTAELENDGITIVGKTIVTPHAAVIV